MYKIVHIKITQIDHFRIAIKSVSFVFLYTGNIILILEQTAENLCFILARTLFDGSERGFRYNEIHQAT